MPLSTSKVQILKSSNWELLQQLINLTSTSIFYLKMQFPTSQTRNQSRHTVYQVDQVQLV